MLIKIVSNSSAQEVPTGPARRPGQGQARQLGKAGSVHIHIHIYIYIYMYIYIYIYIHTQYSITCSFYIFVCGAARPGSQAARQAGSQAARHPGRYEARTSQISSKASDPRRPWNAEGSAERVDSRALASDDESWPQFASGRSA